MKNGEEVVSVGGAVDPSLKNVGTSASNSVLLELSKVKLDNLKISKVYSNIFGKYEKIKITNLKGG